MISNKFLKNGLWLLFEKITSLVSSLFITVYTARYLGPEGVGEINYALAIGALIVPLSQLGSNILIFDKSVKNKERAALLIISSQKIRSRIYISLSMSIILITLLVGDNNVIIISGILFSLYFTSLDSFKPFFDGVLSAKKNVISSQLGMFFSQLTRLALVTLNASVVFFCLPYIVNTLLPYLYKKRLFFKEYGNVNISERKKRKYGKYSFLAGLPLAISSFSVVIYVQIGQVILANKTDMTQVGLYSAANTLSQIWLFVPITVMTVLLNYVLNDKKNKNTGFSFVYLINSIISLLFIAPVFSFSNELIKFTFGNEFVGASPVLNVLIISSFFVIWGYIGVRIIVNQGGHKYAMKKMACMAIFNLIISYYLIGSYGVIGAAYSVLATEIISATIANYFFKKFFILKVQFESIRSLSYFKNYLTRE
ncbi:flippase [Vibrio parahaemolyticus]